MVRLLNSKSTVSLQQLLEGFIEDNPTLDTQYTPQRPDVDEGGSSWGDLVASLEDRYASTRRVAEGDRNERPLEGHPIASFIEKIARLPTNDDYPLWRVRCKVFLTSVIFRHAHTFV